MHGIYCIRISVHISICINLHWYAIIDLYDKRILVTFTYIISFFCVWEMGCCHTSQVMKIACVTFRPLRGGWTLEKRPCMKRYLFQILSRKQQWFGGLWKLYHWWLRPYNVLGTYLSFIQDSATLFLKCTLRLRACKIGEKRFSCFFWMICVKILIPPGVQLIIRAISQNSSTTNMQCIYIYALFTMKKRQY